MIVVGSGVAGLTVALAASRTAKVLLLTKDVLDAGSTSWAQGGIAAAIDVADTPGEHLTDTLIAGAGLCSEKARVDSGRRRSERAGPFDRPWHETRPRRLRQPVADP